MRPTPEQKAERRRRKAARSAEAERKRENRRKYIVGAIAMALMERDARLREAVQARILERDADLFPSLMGSTTGAGEGGHE